MAIEFGLTTEMVNTQYAVLGVLLAHYQQNQVLKSLDQVRISMKSGDFSPNDKVEQVLVSILAGCETISEVNLKLKPEIQLAQLCDWPRFADQSGLSRTLDALTLMNIEQLRQAVTQILHQQGQTVNHDWRGHLYLDFDLSGLPCGKKAQESHRGYFAKKKRNWPSIGPSERHKIPRNPMVRTLSRQSTYRPLFSTGRLSHRKFIRVR